MKYEIGITLALIFTAGLLIWMIPKISFAKDGIIDLAVPLMITEVRDICQIIAADGTTVVESYDDFADALMAVENRQIIRLLDNIDYDSAIVIKNKSIKFDLNGYTLNIEVNYLDALVVDGGELLLDNSGGGELNVKGGISSYGYGAHVYNGGKVTVTNASTNGSGTGVYATNGAKVYVCGNVRGGGTGVYADTSAQVTIDGTVTATCGEYVYITVGGVKKYQGGHELISEKNGYFEYRSASSTVWVKDV